MIQARANNLQLKYSLRTNNAQFTFLPDLFPKLQISKTNCLCDFSAWVSSRYLNQVELSIPSTFLSYWFSPFKTYPESTFTTSIDTALIPDAVTSQTIAIAL